MERLVSLVGLGNEGRRHGASALRLLVIRCGPYRLGFRAANVRGVVGSNEIVSLGLPNLEGVVWRDGALFPVTALAPLLGLRQTQGDATGHGVLVLSTYGPLCFLVDEALDLIEVPAESMVPLPPLILGLAASAGLDSAAVMDGVLLVVDPVRLLGPDRVAGLVATAAGFGGLGASTLGQG